MGLLGRAEGSAEAPILIKEGNYSPDHSKFQKWKICLVLFGVYHKENCPSPTRFPPTNLFNNNICYEGYWVIIAIL